MLNYFSLQTGEYEKRALSFENHFLGNFGIVIPSTVDGNGNNHKTMKFNQ